MLQRFIAGLTVCMVLLGIGLKLFNSPATGATLNKFDIHTNSKTNQVELTIYVDQKAEIETTHQGNVYTLKLKNAQVSQELIDKGLPVVIDNENKLLARAVPLKTGGAKIIIPNMPNEQYQITINQKAKQPSSENTQSAQAFSQIATYTEQLGGDRAVNQDVSPVTLATAQFKGPDPMVLAQIKRQKEQDILVAKQREQAQKLAVQQQAIAAEQIKRQKEQDILAAQQREQVQKLALEQQAKALAESQRQKVAMATPPRLSISPLPEKQRIQKSEKKPLITVAKADKKTNRQSSAQQLAAMPKVVPMTKKEVQRIETPSAVNSSPKLALVQSDNTLQFPRINPMPEQQSIVQTGPVAAVAVADPSTEFNQKHGFVSVVPYAEKVLAQQEQPSEKNKVLKTTRVPEQEHQQTFSFLDPAAYQAPAQLAQLGFSPLKIKPMIGKRPLPNVNPKINFLNTESQFEQVASRFPKPRVEVNSHPMVENTNYQRAFVNPQFQSGSFVTPTGALVMNNPYASPPSQGMNVQPSAVSALYFDEDTQPNGLTTYSAPSVNPWYVNEADQTMLDEEDAYALNEIPDLSQADMVANEAEISTALPQTWVQEVVSAVKSMPTWIFVLLALFFGGIGLFALAGAVLMARLMYQSQVLKQPLIQLNSPVVQPANASVQPQGVGYYAGYPQHDLIQDSGVRLQYTDAGTPSLFEDTVDEIGDYSTHKTHSHGMKEAVNQAVLLKFPTGGKKMSFRTPNKRA